MRRHRGFSILLAAVILIVVIAVVFATIALFGHKHREGAVVDTTTRLARAQDVIEQFASASGRLPCPANPVLDTGDADPIDPALPCASPTGTLPWRTIGLARDDSFDAWGWRISYRVYTGAGSLTQPNGASMALCDTNVSASPGVGPGRVCQIVAGWHTQDTEYLAGKGLWLTDFGAPQRLDIAYVLVSHGSSGLGAYSSAGIRRDLPANVDELANTTATGPFVMRAASDPSIAADDVNHFDDLIAYRTLPDLVNRAKLSARDWPDPVPPGLASVRADATTVSLAVGRTVAAGADLGTSVAFNNATVTATAGGTGEDVTFDIVGGTEGIGGGPGSTQLSSADAEVLRIDFNIPAQVLAFTLDGFGCRSGCSDADQVQLTFYKDGVPLPLPSSPKTLSACNDGDGLASFSIDLGPTPAGDFNRVDITPKPSVPGNVDTTFLVSEFRTCLAGGGCATSLDTGSGPGGNHCS